MVGKRARPNALSKDPVLMDMYFWKYVTNIKITQYKKAGMVFYQIQVTYNYEKSTVEYFATSRGYRSIAEANSELPQFMYCVENCIRRDYIFAYKQMRDNKELTGVINKKVIDSMTKTRKAHRNIVDSHSGFLGEE
jgi:GR25 family glycosyltransferase involved in LPS biosynthesis